MPRATIEHWQGVFGLDGPLAIVNDFGVLREYLRPVHEKNAVIAHKVELDHSILSHQD